MLKIIAIMALILMPAMATVSVSMSMSDESESMSTSFSLDGFGTVDIDAFLSPVEMSLFETGYTSGGKTTTSISYNMASTAFWQSFSATNSINSWNYIVGNDMIFTNIKSRGLEEQA
jgi:hypothetical protein